MNTFNRNVSKITVATLLALTLAACGGGGGGSHSLSTNSTPTKDNKVVSLTAQKEQVIRGLEKEYDGVKVDSYSVKINGKTYNSGNIDLSGLGEGVQRVSITEEATVTTVEGSKGKAVRNSILHIYQQPYSIVAGVEVKGGYGHCPRI
ncbi:hypothetical protein EGK75_13070 [Neisseria weixii]|uniref:Uncharacterized protein n=1 Tax=Neisseria weixii TaxID=1853276 RepID=A0A3N4MNK5_9NEIS|nr:hypothetical protein [Neisseria weixii]RPD83247.1 hypothetical protein EGK74_13040 [Neisseria weixii]RPD83549.1 hypothetical protein EGK75_13070 [Neisseria weixii]